MTLARLCMLGESASGKTQLTKSYQEIIEEKPCERRLVIGAANLFHFKPIISDVTTSLSIWDLPGEERMRTINHLFFKKVDGFIITLDLTNPSAIENLENYFKVLACLDDFKNKPVVLACTKSETDHQAISREQLDEFVKKYSFIDKHFVVSHHIPKQEVKSLFEHAVKLVLSQQRAQCASLERNTL